MTNIGQLTCTDCLPVLNHLSFPAQAYKGDDYKGEGYYKDGKYYKDGYEYKPEYKDGYEYYSSTGEHLFV